MKKNIIKVCLIVQVICVLLFLIDVICLGKDTFCYFIQQVEIVGAVLTCWVWVYYLAKLISFCTNDSKVGRFLLWSISVIVFFIFLIPSMNFILSNIALGCEYRDSRHEILIKVHDPIFFLSYNPQFVFYKKGMIINHYMGEGIGYNLPGDQNKQWKFYDDLGVAVLTADKDLNEGLGLLSDNKFYYIDEAKAMTHKKEISQLAQQLFCENDKYIVIADGYYLKNGFDTRSIYDTKSRLLRQLFFSDSVGIEVPDTRYKHFSKVDNDSIIACIRSIPLSVLPVNVGKDDTLGMSINERIVTDQNAKSNPAVKRKLMWLFYKLN